MPTRIRLQRKGKKGQPYYHIVVADQRAPRDGKYIERIGAYDPNQNPAFIEIDRSKALDWMQKGAQPTDTCRAILSYTGLVYKNHRRFDIWMNEKNTKIEAKRSKLATGAEQAEKARVEAEKKKAEAIAAKVSAKLAASIPAEATATEEAPAAEGEAAAEAPAAE